MLPTLAGAATGNLLTNPGAEDGEGSTVASGTGIVGSIPGWTRETGSMNVVVYGTGGFPASGGGSQFFAGGKDSSSSAFQDVPVVDHVGTGGAKVVLSAQLGGFSTQQDHMAVSAIFFDGAGKRLGTLSIGGAAVNTKRGSETILVPFSRTGTAPAGTRTIRVRLIATRASGTSNDGYADEISLTLDPVAAPPKKPKAKGLSVNYTMPSRFGRRGPDGLIRYLPKKAIAPKRWRVDFVVKRRDGKPCRRSDVLSANAPGSRMSIRQTGRNPCRFQALFPREGKYTVKVSLRTRKGARHRGTREVIVQDWLVFGLGDSNGSGEGAPDVPNRGQGELKWQERKCHRSANSYQALTARGVERTDKRTSVTFVHLACSGASIDVGLLKPYRGIEPGKLFRPQVKAMKTLAQGREIDAVILSIGVNDLGFGALVAHCIELPDCPNQPFPNATSDKTLSQVMQERLASLINTNDFGDNSGLYDQLAGALKKAKIPARRVFITEYFDSTQDENGYCDPLIEVFLPDLAIGEGLFDRAEAQWASESVLGPLNSAVLAAAQKHGWRLIFGSQEGYRTHGYCSSDPWIVGLTESLANQLNKEGTLHSTTRGNVFQAQLVLAEMRKFLYENGRPRAPASERR